MTSSSEEEGGGANAAAATRAAGDQQLTPSTISPLTPSSVTTGGSGGSGDNNNGAGASAAAATTTRTTTTATTAAATRTAAVAQRSHRLTPPASAEFAMSDAADDSDSHLFNLSGMTRAMAITKTVAPGRKMSPREVEVASSMKNSNNNNNNVSSSVTATTLPTTSAVMSRTARVPPPGTPPVATATSDASPSTARHSSPTTPSMSLGSSPSSSSHQHHGGNQKKTGVRNLLSQTLSALPMSRDHGHHYGGHGRQHHRASFLSQAGSSASSIIGGSAVQRRRSSLDPPPPPPSSASLQGTSYPSPGSSSITNRRQMLKKALTLRRGKFGGDRSSSGDDPYHQGSFSSRSGDGSGDGHGHGGLHHHHRAAPGEATRRYKRDDRVLVCHHQSRWANLVNRHGFPPGEGSTPEELKGPYIYVLATVTMVHFDEFNPYYTVTRADTGATQRADAESMVPLKSARAEAAAAAAATLRSHNLAASAAADRAAGRGGGGGGGFGAAGIGGGGGTGGGGVDDSDGDYLYGGDDAFASGENTEPTNKCVNTVLSIGSCLIRPFVWIVGFVVFVFGRFLLPLGGAAYRFLREQARSYLYGFQPYLCKARLTTVNVLVVCSTWFMFADQLRLAAFPPSADYAVAVINFVVWIILMWELIFEIFIRPTGYHELIISEKAYAPTTVRFINAFHLFVEFLMLLLFVPEFLCVVTNKYQCDERLRFSFYNAALMSVTGPTRLDSFYGLAYFALIRLRVFGLVRHWKNMWIANAFINMTWRNTTGIVASLVPQQIRSSLKHKSLVSRTPHAAPAMDEQKKREAALTNASTIGTALMVTNSYRALAILWVITGLFPLLLSVITFYTNPVAPVMTHQLNAVNLVASNNATVTCDYLSDSLWSWVVGMTKPDFESEGEPFLLTLELTPYRCYNQSWAQNKTDITEIICQIRGQSAGSAAGLCETWHAASQSDGTAAGIAHSLGLRTGSVLLYHEIEEGNFTFVNNTTLINLEIGNLTYVYNWENNYTTTSNYTTTASFDQSSSIQIAAISALLLQLCLLLGVLGGLSVLRRDAEVLVLGPLRRMLKIVARYAKNPLIQPKFKKRKRTSFRKAISHKPSSLDATGNSDDSSDEDSEDIMGNDLGLGSYETEQLITAVTKITDLLRKCWGVAGADIISTNLATQEGALTEVFNPTVPGKSVYALFAFAAINGFDYALRCLGGDVMVLINDVANVVHGEVFRWGFGDSGECNKNLGAAFLLVFKIGSVDDVIKKMEQAKNVIFAGSTTRSSSNSDGPQKRHGKGTGSNISSMHSSMSSVTSRRRSHTSKHGTVKKQQKSQRKTSVKAMSLSLQSLPGIRTFTDRAVIGMLKSFAGIHRDKKVLNWNDDFRLGAGVGVWRVSMIYGMDAGWAVEGAVGSEYKIDATYLSPHVNMASRMTGACKQYGVTLMLSQAVQELMSDTAKSKLRHLDTVTVKGSALKQKIYTYDARSKGVDFFLYSKTDDQADVDAFGYTPNIWNVDQDLKAMRQHISEDFLREFSSGRKYYLNGDWPTALKRLERANEMMIENTIDEGYVEDELEELHLRAGDDAAAAADELKEKHGDGPSLNLISFIKSHTGGIAPPDWEGWHPLVRK